MTTFHAWFRTELGDENPHEWTSELEAPDQTAALARAVGPVGRRRRTQLALHSGGAGAGRERVACSCLPDGAAVTARQQEGMLKQKYIVWSFSAEQQQTFADIVVAKFADDATTQWRTKRGDYARRDLYVDPMLLDDYIKRLQRTAAQSNEAVERAWRAL